jgi:peptide/nickel transport system ATP-binding protein
MAAAHYLEVRDLRVDIPTATGDLHAVRGIDFALEKGETLGIVGESGSGKSLTALSLMGLLPPAASRSAAALSLAGEDLLAFSEQDMARRIRGNRAAMIFQEPMTSLNPVYSIGRQLTEVMMLHRGVSRAVATERAMYLLERVGIPAPESRLGQYPHQLSGGQRQRVMIAMALMNEPDLLIADEPTTALDVTIQAEILRLLAELQRELGMSMILITHDLGIVSRVADDVAVMYAGEIVETGRTDALFRDPRHPYTQGLLRCIPEPGRAMPGMRLGSIPGMVPSLVGDLKGCAFAGRCDHAEPRCSAAPVPDVTLGPGRAYRCIRGADAAPMSGASLAPVAAADAHRKRGDETILAVEDIHCRFQVRRGLFGRRRQLHAVNGVSLEIARGETLGLVGESGCGKSTLARILLGIQPADSGRVLLDGQPIAGFGQKQVARRVQPIFQDPYSSLNPRRTIGEIIRRPLDIHNVGDPDGRVRAVQDMMERVGLAARMYHRYPNQISGGQRQRVAIARAIVMRPDIVICDEPTSALDVSVQSQILNLLMDLRDDLGLTYLLITHDLGVVEHMADRVAVMYLGQIVELGATERLFAAPRHPYTRALLDSVPTLAPGAGIADTGMGHNFPNLLDIPTGCAFHPRCPSVLPRCRQEASPLRPVDEGVARCHLFDLAPVTAQSVQAAARPDGDGTV